MCSMDLRITIADVLGHGGYLWERAQVCFCLLRIHPPNCGALIFLFFFRNESSFLHANSFISFMFIVFGAGLMGVAQWLVYVYASSDEIHHRPPKANGV